MRTPAKQVVRLRSTWRAEGQNAETTGRATYQQAQVASLRNSQCTGSGDGEGPTEVEASWRQDHGLGSSLDFKLGLGG